MHALLFNEIKWDLDGKQAFQAFQVCSSGCNPLLEPAMHRLILCWHCILSLYTNILCWQFMLTFHRIKWDMVIQWNWTLIDSFPRSISSLLLFLSMDGREMEVFDFSWMTMLMSYSGGGWSWKHLVQVWECMLNWIMVKSTLLSGHFEDGRLVEDGQLDWILA